MLRNNAGNDLTIAANGGFTFQAALTSGTAYSVSVQAQPANPTQTCTVAASSGSVAANVTNVAVTCTTNTYRIGGAISGLTGTGLVLRNNGVDHAVAAGATSFTFATPVPSGGSYAVSVFAHPSNPNQACIVSNASGNVGNSDATSVSVACSAALTVGGTVSGLQGSGLILSNNGADLLAINADGPFTFRVPVALGATYQALTQAHPLNPDQECTTTRGSGTIVNAIVTDIAVNCYVMGKRLFATNSVAGHLTGATINQTTGVLNALPGVPVLVGANSGGLIATPNGRFLYVLNGDAATIQGFRVDATTGGLTAMSNNPVATGQAPVEAAMDPAGKFLYVTDQQNPRVFGYSIHAVTGELSAIPGSPFTTAAATIYVRVDPTGRFAYVVTRAALDAIALSAYGIDSTTGALTPIPGTPLAVGTSMPMGRSMQLTADGAALFILPSPQPPSVLYGYSLDATTGAPTAMPGSPFTLPAASFLVRRHPRLPVLYVGSQNSIRAYRVGGALTELNGSPSTIVGAVWEIAFDPGARFAYASSASGITMFEVGSDGALAPVINGSFAMPFPSTTLLADPGGRYLFISDFTSGNIQPIAVDTRTGRLSVVQGSAFNGGSGTGAVVVTK